MYFLILMSIYVCIIRNFLDFSMRTGSTGILVVIMYKKKSRASDWLNTSAFSCNTSAFSCNTSAK